MLKMPVFLSYFEDKQGLIEVYNKFSNDFIVGFTELKSYEYISKIKGEKVIAYFSSSQIFSDLQKLKNLGIKWVAFDIEKGYTPQSDLNDTLNSVKSVYQNLKSNGMNLILTMTNLDNLLNQISKCVKYADIFVTQGQNFQKYGPDVYAKQIKSLITLIKQSNPNIKVVSQLSLLKGDLQNCMDSFNKIRSYTDGITLFYAHTSDQLSLIEAFYNFIK
jgi:hypothetical protein